MKTRFGWALASAMLLGGIGSASAADMAVKAPPMVAPPCVWCGFYIGVNAGGIWSNGNADFGGDPSTIAAIARGQLPSSLRPNGSGFIGGGQVGFNAQRGAFVWGIEGDIQGTTLDRTVSFSSNLAPAFFPATTTAQEKMDVFATLRGRVGITASPMLLLYVTGGLAVGDPRLTSTVTTFPVVPGIVGVGTCAAAGFCGAATSGDDWRAGWTVGAGAEWKINPRWSVKGEYLYYDLGNVGVTMVDNLGRFPGVFVTANERFTGSIARVGINYAFGGGPVVAKY